MATPPLIQFTPPPIQSGWASDPMMGPATIWALWFQNIWNILKAVVQPDTSYVSTTNITHGGTLTKSMSVTKAGSLVTLILTYSDTVSTSSTIGTTTFSLPYIPLGASVVSAINSTTHASLNNGYISTNGNLYPPTFTTGAGEVAVLSVSYFTG